MTDLDPDLPATDLADGDAPSADVDPAGGNAALEDLAAMPADEVAAPTEPPTVEEAPSVAATDGAAETEELANTETGPSGAEGLTERAVAESEGGAEEPATEPAAADTATEPAADEIASDETGTDKAATDEPSTPPAGVNADGEIVDTAEVLDEDQLLAENLPKPESPYDRPGQWFVVHTQSGHEKKVKQNLEARIVSMNMEDRIYEAVIPMEDVVEFKAGKKVVVQKKVFPGYLLVRLNLSDDSWYVVRQTPGITGFVHQGNSPVPLRRKDVEKFLAVAPEGGDDAAKPARPRLEYELNESVRVKQGPFKDFTGEIVEINPDQLKVKVLVNIFGRETPVELEFSQIAKL